MDAKESIAAQLEALFQKQGKDFMPLGVLEKALVKALPEELKGEVRSGKSHGFKERITPCLRDKFVFLKKGNSTYLALNLPREELFLKVVRQKPGKTFGELARALPFKAAELRESLNKLLERRVVWVTFSTTMKPRLYPEEKLAATPVVAPVPAKETDCTEQAFADAFSELDRGQYFVRICNMRRRLNWPREVFDAMLCRLRDAETIQMHTGDLGTMTAEDIRDSYKDENGFLMLTLTWSK